MQCRSTMSPPLNLSFIKGAVSAEMRFKVIPWEHTLGVTRRSEVILDFLSSLGTAIILLNFFQKKYKFEDVSCNRKLRRCSQSRACERFRAGCSKLP
jgi:hypothetical protein